MPKGLWHEEYWCPLLPSGVRGPHGLLDRRPAGIPGGRAASRFWIPEKQPPFLNGSELNPKRTWCCPGTHRSVCFNPGQLQNKAWSHSSPVIASINPRGLSPISLCCTRSPCRRRRSIPLSSSVPEACRSRELVSTRSSSPRSLNVSYTGPSMRSSAGAHTSRPGGEAQR